MSSSWSMPITSDMDYVDAYVNVVLRDIHSEESLPVRHFPVGSTWSFKVGRGSQNEEHMRPQSHNSWFGSRVMSREHAEICIDQVTKEIKISDLASMHGTYLHGRKLNAGEKIALSSHDVVTFGTDVVRGEHTYLPLQLEFDFEWSDCMEPSAPVMKTSPRASQSRSNRISILVDDDDDDDDDYEDDELEFIAEATTIQTNTKTGKPTTFSVPDSDDDSESDSEFDEQERSSPITFDHDEIEEVSEKSYYESSALSKGEKTGLSHLSEPSQRSAAPVIVVGAEQSRLPETNMTIDMAEIFAGDTEFCLSDIISERYNDDNSVEQHQRGSAFTYPHYAKVTSESVNEVGFGGNTVVPELDHIEADKEDSFRPSATLEDERLNVPSASWPQNEAGNTDETGGANFEGAIHVWANANHMASDVLHDRSLGEDKSPAAQLELSGPERIHQVVDVSNSTSELVQDCKPKEQHRSEKLSIHNIINDTDIPSRPQLKRKIEEMLHARMDHTGVDVPDSHDLFSTSQPNAIPEVKAATVSEEPPRKLVKIEREPLKNPSKGKTFLKYTAAAAAGAAVGAVTAVFGLAALPAEYFV